MEKIKVGEYVRTKEGIIGKIEQIGNSLYWLEDGSPFNIQENSNKHSRNVIDLIEVGDYVNGYKVLDIMEDMETGEIHLEMTSDYTNEIIGDCTIYNDDIKTIVTHEQFSNIEYRLEN